MKLISLNNGNSYMTAEEAIHEILENKLWPVVANMMDADTREQVRAELSPCTELEFLRRYLELAPYDIVIG